MEAGITPVKESVSNVTYVRPVRLPNAGLMVPERLFWLSWSWTAMPFVHETPVKSQELAWVHASEVGFPHELYMATKAVRSVAEVPSTTDCMSRRAEVR